MTRFWSRRDPRRGHMVVTIIGDPNTVLLIGEEDGTYDIVHFRQCW